MKVLPFLLLFFCVGLLQAQNTGDKTATVVNGVLLPGTLDELDPDNIGKIKIIRDETVIEKRFPGQEYDVILEVTTKDYQATRSGEIIATEPMFRVRNYEATDSIKVLVDGQEFDGSLDDLNPEDIESIHVYKDKPTLATRYPNEQIRGIIEITTKAAADRKQHEQQPADEVGEIFRVVEKMPVYLCPDGSAPSGPNELQCLIEWLQENLEYPEKAEKRKLEGKVMVQFIVEKDGSVSGVRAVKSPHSILEKAAVELVRAMGPWSPGVQRGRPVRVQFVLPVNFALD